MGMKIALLGTAPSSARLAPYGDPSWHMWGCSPGLFYQAPRLDAWFELHRWEPPVIGKPDQQVPWYSPEYCLWMARLKVPVWMLARVPEIPMSQALPWQELVKKYGHFFFNSSLSWMTAMAIEAILLNRELEAAALAQEKAKPDYKEPENATPPSPDMLGYWGVDMAADEEQYTAQKSGLQFFATLAASLGIRVVTPPESDLMVPRPLYGITENSHRAIKLLVRQKEAAARRAHMVGQRDQLNRDIAFIDGVLDDMKYHLNTWVHEGEILGPKFEEMPFARPALPAPVAESLLGKATPEAPLTTTGTSAGSVNLESSPADSSTA